MNKKKVGWNFAAAAVSLALVATAAPFAHGDGGTGGTGGGGTVSGDFLIRSNWFDEGPTNNHKQGFGQDSINWFLNDAGISSSGATGKLLQQSCSNAIDQANQRAKASGDANPVSRVVGIEYAFDPGHGINSNYSAFADASLFQKESGSWANLGYPGVANVKRADGSSYPQWIKSLADQQAVASAAPYVSTVCVALNDLEPTPANYNLTITTDHGTVPAQAGTVDPVTDIIHADNGGSSIHENVNAQIILNWDLPDGGSTQSSQTKTQSIANSGDTTTSNLLPSDFGLQKWPAGHFWFSVKVPKQGMMAADASTPGDRDPRESYDVPPPPPVKQLYLPGTDTPLSDSAQLAAGQTYDTRVSDDSSSYNEIQLNDVINTDKVWIGGTSADDPSKVVLLGPDGKAVSDAKITIDRKTYPGRVVVSGSESNLKQQGVYTLLAPTYVLPTGSDYTIPDDSKACFGTDFSKCYRGDSRVARKVTPSPNKVWILGQDGAITTTDPDWTNQKGVDNALFLPGQSVGAVTHGHIPANLPEALNNYVIFDDWSDALKYIDFSDAKQVVVMRDGKDVTSQFDITVDPKAGKTTAKMKADALASTKGLAADSKIDLYIGGKFRTDYDTKGETVKMLNKGGEIWNTEQKPTNTPPVFTNTPLPHKTEQNPEGQNTDGQTVVKGSHILYKLKMDTGVPRAQLAGDVHKLGMVDDYDENYLSLDAKNIKAIDGTTGKDISSKFNFQVINGQAYMFVKQADSVGKDGKKIPGDPQPADLAAYDAAAIVPGETPIIDQSILGQNVYFLLDTVVTKDAPKYTIKNQGREHFENINKMTEVVSNPLTEINPTKDVVVDPTNPESLNGKTIVLNSVFNYRLNSVTLPANRADNGKDWKVTDTFKPQFDQFTGTWAVYADTDIYDGQTQVFKKGDLLADSTGKQINGMPALFTSTWDNDTSTFVAAATPDFLKLINSRRDLPQGWSAYTQMLRVAPSNDVENIFTDTFNSVDRPSNKVHTNTPEHPAISVLKYDMSEGEQTGDRNSNTDPLVINDPKNGTQIGFKVTNTGDVPLKNVTLSDKTVAGSGTVQNITCKVPAQQGPNSAPTVPSYGDKGTASPSGSASANPSGSASAPASAQPSTGTTQAAPAADEPSTTASPSGSSLASPSGSASANPSGSASNMPSANPTISVPPSVDPVQDATQTVTPDKIGYMAVGQVVYCQGTLEGVQPDATVHTDTATVNGQSYFTGTPVTASDDWNGMAPLPPSALKPLTGAGAVTGDPMKNAGKDAELDAAIALFALAMAGAGMTAVSRLKSEKVTK